VSSLAHSKAVGWAMSLTGGNAAQWERDPDEMVFIDPSGNTDQGV